MRYRFYVFVLLGLLMVGAITAGCSAAGQNKEGNGQLVVVTTIYPVWDFTSHVSGDRARVVQLVPDGAEPHDWEPAPRDIADLERADVFIYNGSGMESWVGKILSNLSDRDTVLVDCSQGLDLLPVEGSEGMDPHLWLDPLTAMGMVDNITDGLSQASPGDAEYFAANAVAFKERLQALHEKYDAVLGQAGQRKFVVAHAAYGYLARRYDLQQVPIAGIEHEAQPGPARVAEVIKTVREYNIRYIFAEELAGARSVEAIAEETGAEVLTLNPLGGLTRAQRESGKDYHSVMEENLVNLARALEVK